LLLFLFFLFLNYALLKYLSNKPKPEKLTEL
jgi:hypothetical protein